LQRKVHNFWIIIVWILYTIDWFAHDLHLESILMPKAMCILRNVNAQPLSRTIQAIHCWIVLHPIALLFAELGGILNGALAAAATFDVDYSFAIESKGVPTSGVLLPFSSSLPPSRSPPPHPPPTSLPPSIRDPDYIAARGDVSVGTWVCAAIYRLPNRMAIGYR